MISFIKLTTKVAEQIQGPKRYHMNFNLLSCEWCHCLFTQGIYADNVYCPDCFRFTKFNRICYK